MRYWVIGLFAGCCLFATSASVHATGVGAVGRSVDPECFDSCIDSQTADKCSAGAVQVCTSRCTFADEPAAFYNGVQTFGSIERTANGIEYYASPLVNACNDCLEENSNPNSNFGSVNTCAVMPSSSSNICSDLDPNFVPTVTVGLVSNAVFAESIRLGRVLWNLDAIRPCDPIGTGTQTIYSGTIKCNVGMQAGGQGCAEKRKGDTTVSQLCYFGDVTASGCNISTTTTKCTDSSVDTCSDGNQVGVY